MPKISQKWPKFQFFASRSPVDTLAQILTSVNQVPMANADRGK
jgi:hypothetical protein